MPLITRHSLRAATGSPLDAPARPLRILLAEDNLVNQRLAVKILEKRGHTVVVASNGKEAVEAYGNADFDVILMDVQMPEVNGLEATQAIREKEGGAKHIPIIAMTAHAMKGDKEKCLAAGMDAYISKPINTSELFATLERFTLHSESISDGSTQSAERGHSLVEEDLFDLSKTLETAGGDKEFLKEIVGLFLETLPEYLAHIREAISGNDAHALERAAHSLKGAVGNFGIGRAFAAAYRLEEIAKGKELAEAVDAFAELERTFERLETAMKDALEEL
jgi:CheY-like chemotaxis protein